jgi:uncharacterized caspase-like protein
MAKVALLVGVGNYEHSTDLKPLASASKDVAALQRVLLNPNMGGFSEVVPLTDPDPMQMQGAIESLYRDRTKDDLVLLFFSGHGIKDDRGNLHFATRITQKTPRGELIRSTAVPARFVYEIMANCRSRRQVVILDCCFSGAFDLALQSKDDGSLDIQNQLGAEGRVVLTSSSSTQYSFAQPGAELSIYTQHLIEGIETGAADGDNDGHISVRELHDYAARKVQDAAPTMNPKIIVLKDEGFAISFAQAQITDPKLKYRKEAERYSSRGSISPAGRRILDTLRDRLGVSSTDASDIEDLVLQPFRQRLENLQHYQAAFTAELEQEYPLTQETLQVLQDLQKILGLREEDVAPVQQEALQPFARRLALTQAPQPPLDTAQQQAPVHVDPSVDPSVDPPDALTQLKRSVENIELPTAAAPAAEPIKASAPVQLLTAPVSQQNQPQTPRFNLASRNPRSLALVGGALAIVVGGIFMVSLPHSQPKPSPTPTETTTTPALLSSRELFNQAANKQNKGDNPGAIADYIQAIQINKDWGVDNPSINYYGLASTYYNMGNAYSVLGEKQKAIARYNQAIQLKPDYVFAYNNRGRAYSDLGDEQKAIADYNQAIQLKPDHANAYYNRGLAHQVLNNKPKAKQDFQKAADLYQQQGNATQQQNALDQIKKLQ